MAVAQPAILVIGVDSLIGGALVRAWSERGACVMGTTRRGESAGNSWIPLDLSGPSRTLPLPRRIDVAYLCAAITSLDRCEVDPAGTAQVNVENTVAVARQLAASDAWLLLPSSNIVFDGSIPWRKADDPVCPPAEYGRQKSRAEASILALGERAAILRLGKVVGRTTEPFAGWIRSLRKGDVIEAFTDKVCAPLSLATTVALMLKMGENRVSGVFQACAQRDIAYDQAAATLARTLGAGADQVRRSTGRDRGIRASFLPVHTTLDSSRLREALGWAPPDPERELLEGLGV